MKVLLNSESHHYTCPVSGTECRGGRCMAWREKEGFHENDRQAQALEARAKISIFLQSNLKIEAIREYRSFTGLSLKDSKDQIENGSFYDNLIRPEFYNKYRYSEPSGYCSLFGM